jgi:hypothetical protein
MSSIRALTAELRALLLPAASVLDQECATLAEFVAFGLDVDEATFESKMDPFKRKSRIGPGPYGRRNVKRRKDRFKCKCSSQGGGALCKCKSRTRKKTVYVSYDYKNSYNPVYRAWLKKRRKSKLKKKKTQSFQTKAKVG